MGFQTPDIQLNTVGQIAGGTYAGWYVWVSVKSAPGFADSYTVYLCSDSTFAFEPGVRECFDEWAQNWPSLEGVFEDRIGAVTWHPEIPPPQIGTDERGTALANRFRTRRDPADGT